MRATLQRASGLTAMTPLKLQLAPSLCLTLMLGALATPGWAQKRPPGCRGASQDLPAAIQRLEQTQAQADFPAAASAAWDAWCASGKPEHLVSACAMQVRAGACGSARQLLSYSARRGPLGEGPRQGLDQCRRELALRCDSPSMPPATAPAPVTDPPLETAPPTTAPPAPAADEPAAPARLELRVSSSNVSADGAFVSIDGVLRAQVPEIILIPGGRHLLEVEAPGAPVWRRTLDLHPGETRVLYPHIQPSNP